jgi:hypothetical protein
MVEIAEGQSKRSELAVVDEPEQGAAEAVVC